MNKICIICKDEIKEEDYGNGKIWDGTHNPDPWPSKVGEWCCTDCNNHVVSPTRFYLFKKYRQNEGERHE
jgi:hypothetical protein|tara:strand:+ start:324 stop:533 length:210 start_codon:yes stop_codon:yes gene_type:complete